MIFRPIYYLRPYFSLSLSLIVVIQIRGHIAGSPHPLPTTVRALHFYHDKISALSSRVDSGRIVHPSYCTAVGALSSISCLFFLRNSSKSHHGGIRMHRPTLLIIIVYSIRGVPLDHRGDRWTYLYVRNTNKNSDQKNEKSTPRRDTTRARPKLTPTESKETSKVRHIQRTPHRMVDLISSCNCRAFTAQTLV